MLQCCALLFSVLHNFIYMCRTPVRAVVMVKLIEIHINEAKISVEIVLLKIQKVTKHIPVESLF